MYFLKAYKAVVERVDKDLRATSRLTLAEFELLHLVVRAHGRIRFIDLAKVTLLSQSRISRQIDVLQGKGFLHREITASDRRATYAVLTPAGRKAYDDALQPFLRAYHDEFADLIPENDVEGFGLHLLSLLKEPDYSARITAIMDAARAANSGKAAKKASRGKGR
jgi:DNA-binding MarR family transcriptional regulator